MRFALIFDLDGTLVDSEHFYDPALQTVGLSSASAAFRSARQQVKTLLPEGSPAARNRLLYLKALLDQAKDFSASQTLDWALAYETALEELCRQNWRDLQRDSLFEQLASQHALFILSNENTRTQLIKLRAMDPHGAYFERMWTSEEIGVEKPDPKGFRTALHFIQEEFRIEPAQCWMIGDDLEKDILPAKQLGLKTILTHEFGTSNTVHAPSAPDHQVRQLSDILPILTTTKGTFHE